MKIIFSLSQKFIALFLICFVFQANSQVRLPRLISDGMVLQRDIDLKIWGWASPGERVELKFVEKTYSTTTGNDGTWNLVIPKMSAGGPYIMNIEGSNKLVINNILVGDVWLCSGQSNMELNMRRASPIYQNEIANCENQNIRQFIVPQKYNFNVPQQDLSGGNWVSADPQTIYNFSAVGYFFAKELYDLYKVPVGIINASLGGSPIESWMSEEAIKKFPVAYQEAQKFKDTALIIRVEKEDNERIGAWYSLLNKKDEGYKTPGQTWRDPVLNTTDWATMKVPGYWANTNLGPVNGVVWFRKEIQVPASMAGKQVKLEMGRIVDADSVFVNGAFVGTVSYQYPPRRYEIPAGILKEGRNTIVVRVISNSGLGGFVLDKVYEIVDGDQKIDLSGNWQYKLGATMEPLGSQTFVRWKPTGLYNGMINPLLNYKIKGAVWYQGESNTWNANQYFDMLSTLIADWRTRWNIDSFPFIIVQLPNFMETKDHPSESNWALLRYMQLKMLSVHNTGLAVTIDLGEWNDIHPLNKKDASKRIALAAQKVAYGDDKVIYSGPLYKSMKIDGNKIIINFSNIGSGLIVKGGGDLKYFAIAGEGKKFVWAKAIIEGNTVVLWSEEVAIPVAVRYAWADNPDGANLYNNEGLPASPFRTDVWNNK
jgi:sialate O-acetylesterase